ncbi:secondary thiamine-phosphate synthase enzyme YjbQ [Mesobacillus foraminis]|jgi:secondary thiamine-phosphate synthase enzyme|uniref:secondary thiamine-phosphate synthase enzyme YjbQ n=1 Tax=Mesobacillus foraminis TaxID=279826 RepID=UPI0039A392DB
MVSSQSYTLLTDKYLQQILITDKVKEAVANSGVQKGIVSIITMHTTTGISVNEDLECLSSDIDNALNRLVPEELPYTHARMLHSYGSTAGNPTGHIKSMLVGNSCTFPVWDGSVILGGAQDIFFYEFDGPSQRTFKVVVIGE